jgi:hypothetical protein
MDKAVCINILLIPSTNISVSSVGNAWPCNWTDRLTLRHSVTVHVSDCDSDT